jgi:hypothetical protein
MERRVINKFFSQLFPDTDPKGLIEVREIGNESECKFFSNAAELITYSPPSDKNVYFGLYKRGYNKKGDRFDGSKSNCLSTRIIYLDFDYMTLDQIQLCLLENNIPVPTAIVNSGNGYHLYWVLTQPVYDLTNLIKAMQVATGADPRAVDKARTFRLPGSYNVKDPNNKKKCKIIELNEVQYDIQKFLDLFNVEITIEKKKEFKDTINLSTHSIEKHCIKEILKGVPDGFRHFSLGR